MTQEREYNYLFLCQSSYHNKIDVLAQCRQKNCQPTSLISLGGISFSHYRPRPLCKEKPETQHHIVSNWNISTMENRYTWRHNSVLYTIVEHIKSVVNLDNIYADLPNNQSPALLFESIRPDLCIKQNPLYGLNSVPLITMIEQKNFEQVMKYQATIATILEHNILYLFFSIMLWRCSPKKGDLYFFKPSNLRSFNLSFSHNV